MPNEIKQKYSASAAMTITLASLPSSTAGVGRQTTLVDNSVTKFERIIVFARIKLGTSPTGSRNIYFYLLRSDNDGTPSITDNAGASDAAITVKNAIPVGSALVGFTPSTGDEFRLELPINDPGPKWGIAVVHDTGANLNSTGSNHWLRWIGVNPEVQ